MDMILVHNHLQPQNTVSHLRMGAPVAQTCPQNHYSNVREKTAFFSNNVLYSRVAKVTLKMGKNCRTVGFILHPRVLDTKFIRMSEADMKLWFTVAPPWHDIRLAARLKSENFLLVLCKFTISKNHVGELPTQSKNSLDVCKGLS